MAQGTVGVWANTTANAAWCGDYLVWGCIAGVVIYIWFPSRAELIAALAVLFAVFGAEILAAIGAALAGAGAGAAAAGGALAAGLGRLLGPLLGGGGRLIPSLPW